MSFISPTTYTNNFDVPLISAYSVPAEWQRSKSHLRGSSVELLTACLPLSSSATSSGYWEDYESIGASAHEIVNYNPTGFGKLSRGSRSCVTVHSTLWSPVNPGPESHNDAKEDQWPVKNTQSNRRLYYQNTFGSFDDEDDRPQSPKSVMVKIPAPTIQMNLSSELLRSQSQSSVDLAHIATEESNPLRSGSFLTNRILPRQHSLPTKSQSFQDSWVASKTQGIYDSGSPEHRIGTWRSNLDASDSDEDESDFDGERPEPRTLFEAALRRARLADSQREVNISVGGKSGRVMPDWGSPINRNRRIPVADNIETPESSETVTDGIRTIEGHNSPPTSIKTLNPVYAGRTPPLSNLTVQQLHREESPHFILNPRDTDWCTGIETWLNSRPRWLYQTRATEDKDALQLCYLNDSDEALWSDSSETDAIMDELSATPASPNSLSMKDEQVVETTESNISEGKSSLHGQLFRDIYEFSEVNARLEKAEQYFELYFKQCEQECNSSNAEQRLAEVHKKCQKTQQEVHFSLAQASKIAHMQLELEKPVWSVITPTIAVMLKINVKPRTVLPLSTLNQLTCAQLQLVMNDIHSVIHNLNTTLMESLMERDELHLEHGAKLIELDDLLAHLKELCIRISIRQYRRKLTATELESPYVPQKSHHVMNKSLTNSETSNQIPARSRSFVTDPSQFWGPQPCGRLTLKQRLVSAFSRQKPTTC